MSVYVVPYLHVLSFMVLFGALLAEHLLFKPGLTATHARTLVRVDVVYGIAALMVLITGVVLVAYIGKGLEYYLASTIFIVKVGLFFAVALLSIVPTKLFLSWRKGLKSGNAPIVDQSQLNVITIVLRIELLGMLILPLLAVMLARGAG